MIMFEHLSLRFRSNKLFDNLNLTHSSRIHIFQHFWFVNSRRKMRRYRLGLFISIIFFSTLLVKVRMVVSTNGGESSSETRTVTRYESIIKRTYDERSYRGLKLKNDLKILLVRCPTSKKASVTMSIGVGSLNDHDELPGLAHLMGEMLNRSSSRMDPENQFSGVINSELSINVQLPNTFPNTEEDEQIFHFNIDHNYLSPALEIFSRIFHEPLFLTSNTRNQLVTSIDQLDWRYSTSMPNRMSNKWRFFQLKKSISSESHAFHRSPYGDSETFIKYLAEAEVLYQPHPTRLHNGLRKFYSEWYSSNVMCLVVLGRETLDELERVTVPLFENIQNRYTKKLKFSYEEHPWGQEQLQHKIYSASDTSFLHSGIVRLVFRVPDIRHQYKTAPELYVMEFLKRRGPGSLMSVLEKDRLCEYIKVVYEVNAGIGFFSIKCEVLWNGEMKEDEIVSLILQYIRFLRKDGIKEWIFRENKIRHDLSARINPYGDSVKYIARAMHDYPMEDILVYEYHQDEWKPLLIEDFLSYLTADNMNIFIDSKKFQGILEERNEWHKIPYDIEIIPAYLIEKWKTTDISPDFWIAQPNEFLATNPGLVHPLKKNEPENLKIIRTTPGSRFWFSQDDQSSHVRIRFTLTSVKGYQDPSHSTFFCILGRLLTHLMYEFVYPLAESEYGWAFISSKSFIEIRLEGYEDKIQTVLEKIMSKITVDQLVGSHLMEPFEIAKIKCIVEEKSRRRYPTAMHRLEFVLTEAAESWSSDEIISVSESLQLKDWEKFIRKMLSRIFIQGVIFGNCVRKSALNIAQIIEKPFQPISKNIPQEIPSLFPRVVEIEGGRHFVNIVFRKVESQFHFHFIYYQFGVGTNQNTIMSTLIMSMIRSKCDILEEDGIFEVHNVIGLLVSIVQAHVHPPEYTDAQFESCLKEVHIMLQEMGDTEFEEYVKLLIEDELDHMLRAEVYWYNIKKGLYGSLRNLDSPDEGMRLITKMDVLMFFEDKLYEHSLNRRKYTVLIFPESSERAASSSSVMPEAIKIEDVMTFRNDSNLFSLPVPYTNISSIED